LADAKTYGCIPAAQKILNSVCSKISAGNYNCTCSGSGYIYPVTLSTVAGENNDNGPTKGCARFNLSNCNIWKVKDSSATTTVLIATSSYKAFELICKTCVTGYNAWSIATPTKGTITYEAGLTDLVGCPKDGIFDSTCTSATIDFTTNVYTCICAGGTSLIKYTTSQTQPVTVGCIVSNTGLPYDSDCVTYTYNSNVSNIVCNKCTNNKLITAVGDLSAAPKTYTYCSTKPLITGCSKYVVT
jgi:hypothetical protein